MKEVVKKTDAATYGKTAVIPLGSYCNESVAWRDPGNESVARVYTTQVEITVH